MFFLCFCQLYQEQFLFDFNCKAFCILFHLYIKSYFCLSNKFRSSSKSCGIRHVVFNFSSFCIQICLSNQTSNTRYFIFTQCGFCIVRSRSRNIFGTKILLKKTDKTYMFYSFSTINKL